MSRVNSYAEYEKALNERGDIFAFRGQPNSEFSLLPSGLRGDKRATADALMFRFVDEMRRLFDFDELTCIEIAQHFALPTRMLDFSYSFDVALFFACHDAHYPHFDGEVFIFNKSKYEKMLKDTGKLSGQVIRSNKFLYDWLQKYLDRKSTSEGNIGVDLPVFVDATMQFDRLAIQKGLFLLWGSEEQSFEDIMEHEGLKLSDYVSSVVIAAEAKPRILAELAQRSISEDSLYMNISKVRSLVEDITKDSAEERKECACGKQQQ